MNFLVVVADTFRRDHLGCYGGAVETPYLDRLASESVVFDRAYAGSFPTLPCRIELFTGRIAFPYRTWGPLPQDELVLSEVFRSAGYSTALVSDNFPMGHAGYGFERGFETSIRVQGQWYDSFRPRQNDISFPTNASWIGEPGRVQQYLTNVCDRTTESDYFAPQTVESACRWLETQGRRRPFLLWVDIFDPHEPWDPPRSYVPEAESDDFPWILYPHFGPANRYTADQLEAMRALYRGEVRLVDRWIGVLLAKLKSVNLDDDTTIVFLSDHGMFFGEHNLLGKGSKIPGDIRGWPPYEEVAHIPLMVRVPGARAGRSQALVHPGDLTPALVELAGIPIPDRMTARSIIPILRRQAETHRSTLMTSWALRGARMTRPSVVRDDDWSMVFWRTGAPPELYHRASDPGETRNLWPAEKAEGRRLHGRMLEFLRANHCPPRNYWPRRWFVSWGTAESVSERSLAASPGSGTNG